MFQIEAGISRKRQPRQSVALPRLIVRHVRATARRDAALRRGLADVALTLSRLAGRAEALTSLAIALRRDLRDLGIAR